MLKITRLSKQFGERQVLTELSLSLQPGEIYGLLGPNGAGKTTALNLLCGLLQPDSGEIMVQGRPVDRSTKRVIGVMPQQNLLYQSLTCAENLAFIARIYGLNKKETSRRVQICLESVNLSARSNSVVGNLSGGMQRRLSLAAAIVHQPKLVVLDEPSTGLDIEARYEVWELIRSLKQQGVTVLLTTHLLDEVERLCDRIGIIKQGRLLAEGTLEHLREQIPAKEVVVIDTDDEVGVIARAQSYGFTLRRYGRDLAFWVPELLELPQLLQRFSGLPINSISRRAVGLDHIYLEVTQNQSHHTIGREEEIPSLKVASAAV
ncbi:heme ABC exporter, ATP-binding protein CcmA, putative [Synechococcus sp. PCC 7335]|uniref:ABC transporter ATP-binding protein n=1 Tax=Synechococcus sp. (strain ATCC 29403 / PCC 7335) TaxID=91464 RepID=UPI00017EE063|nr:ABC transporter ATP-binding protein [Synechococcus sp. PCC 7335]EDX85105.1 heme ABC exporter, ATP-binding protein CcmA, putative [Synechococcus sp. PCC 7335]